MNSVLRNARTKDGKTIRAVAADLSVPERTYAKWEYGLGLPSAAYLVRVARYFGLREADIVNGMPGASSFAGDAA